MIFDYTVKQDGQTYEPGQNVPDMGSVVCTSYSGKVRDYELLSKDLDKLPKYDDLGTGSSAYVIDTAEFYKYESTTKMWYKQ